MLSCLTAEIVDVYNLDKAMREFGIEKRVV